LFKLLLFNREGDCLAAKLRPGNVHSADGWEDMLLREIKRQQKQRKEVVFRADAAFAKPEIYEALEERGVKYAIRIPSNDSLEQDINELITRPVGRPSHKPVVWYKGFSTRQRTGRRRAEWWRRWSSILESCPSRGIHRHEPERTAGRWCGSTTSGKQRSNGSSRASRRSR
jgi:hypothetical protein